MIVTLDPANREHLDAFAALHEATLPDSVPVQLGRRFMTGFYFSRLAADGLVAGDLACIEGRFVGYNLYTKHPASFMSEGVRRHFFFLCGFMPWVFATRPRALLALPHLLRNSGGLPDLAGTGYWLTFGVNPDARGARLQGKSIGQLLIERMIDYFREQGLDAVEGTVERSNRSAIFLYRICGFAFEDRGLDGGSKLQVRYDLRRQAA